MTDSPRLLGPADEPQQSGAVVAIHYGDYRRQEIWVSSGANIGNLTDNDPWHLELWARDDANAKGSTARWCRTGTGDDGQHQRVSWDWLQDHARGYGSDLTVLGDGAQ